jgi:hypothetical protein
MRGLFEKRMRVLEERLQSYPPSSAPARRVLAVAVLAVAVIGRLARHVDLLAGRRGLDDGLALVADTGCGFWVVVRVCRRDALDVAIVVLVAVVALIVLTAVVLPARDSRRRTRGGPCCRDVTVVVQSYVSLCLYPAPRHFHRADEDFSSCLAAG